MKRYIYLVLVGFLFAQSAAYAEMIHGMIAGMDPANDLLIIKRTDGSTPQQLNVKVTRSTQAKNVASLKELKVGHEVNIDAKQDKASGVYEAKSVEVTGSQSAPASSTSQAPASSTSPSASSSQQSTTRSGY